MGQMSKIAASSIVLGLGALNSTSYAQSQDDIAKQFVGMWRLASWPQRLADGTTRQNPISVAYLVFPDAGHTCYVAMDPNRPRWKSQDAPTAEEALSGIRGFGAYCATIELHAKEGFLIQHREIDQNPNGVGSAHKRWFAFQGTNRMSLRIDTPELSAPVVESTLIWERVVK